jgi:hypothetical protein
MVTKASESAQSKTPVAETAPTINWATITDLSEARAALGVVFNASDILGDGSEFITDKNRLVGVSFLVCDWRFIIDEKTQREYVNVMVMNERGDKARFNDGSTGIYAQLKSVTEQAGVVGIACKGGLRRSDYTTEVNGKAEAATTYYLATS